MSDVTHPVARPRLVEILSHRPIGSLAGKTLEYRVFKDGQNFVEGNGSWWAEPDVAKIDNEYASKPPWTRAVRAIALLEHFATPDAIAILKEMSTGHTYASPTLAANTALENLNVSK